MVKKDKVPDAWNDDDWETQADRAAEEAKWKPEAVPEPPVVVSRTERLARHNEMQRKIWEAA
jgi:hypothetical protein